MRIQRRVSLMLALMLMLSSLSSTSFASDEEPKVKLLSAVGDGLRYYIVYEINGREYRSDRTGERINQMAFSMFTEEEKMAVSSNYAYSPENRKIQFGLAGSEDITSWANDATGWTEAAQIWQERLEAKYFDDLKDFYSLSSSRLPLGDGCLGDYALRFSPEVEKSSDYARYIELRGKIKNDFDAGKAFYERLVQIKVNQVGNAVKVGSEGVIKIIIDNFMVPAITPAATMKYTGSVVNAINLAFDSSASLRSYALSSDPSIGDILEQMEIFIGVLENAARELKAEVERDLAELESIMARLSSAQSEVVESSQTNYETNRDAIVASGDAAFQWSGDIVEYEESGTTDEEIRNEVLSQASDIAAEYNQYLDGIAARMAAIESAGISKNLADTTLEVEIEGAQHLFDLMKVTPMELYKSGGSYGELESIIASEAQNKISYIDGMIVKLSNYAADYEQLIADAGIGLDSIEAKINGLSEKYAEYVGGSLRDYVFLQKTPDQLRQSLEDKIVFEEATIYEIKDTFQAQRELLTKKAEEFQAATTEFEADLELAMAPYSSYLANFDNSADQYIEYYNKLDDLYAGEYFQGQRINMDYVDALILNEEPELRAAKTAEIVEDLESIMAEEALYIRRLQLAKNNIDYDLNQLSRTYSKAGAFAYKALDNLRDICGKNYVQLGDYFIGKVGDIYGSSFRPSDANEVSRTLLGHSAYLDDLTLIEMDILGNKSSLMSMPQEEFDAAVAEYQNDAGNVYQDVPASPILTDSQKKSVIDEYAAIINLIYEMRDDRNGGPAIPVSEIAIVIKKLPFLPTGWIELSTGSTLQMSGTAKPDNATNKKLIWTSSNPSIAQVSYSDTGDQASITGVSPGITTVRIASQDGGAAIESTVNVVAGAYSDPYEYFHQEIISDRSKIWNISFTREVKNTPENLAQVYVMDEFENIIHSVQPYAEGNTVQLINSEEYKSGKYVIVVEGALQSVGGKSLNAPVKKFFNVE